MRSTRMKALALLGVMAFVPVFAACAGGTGAAKEGSAVNIAFLGYTGGDFPTAFADGAKSVVGENGGDVTSFDAQFDPQQQIQQCQDAVTSGRFQAIILAPVDPATGVPCAAAAAAAGIPVATVETAVGTDPYSLEPQVAGVVAVAVTPLDTQVEADAELVRAACGDAVPCTVIAEVSAPTDRWTNDVVDGLNEALAPDAEIVQKIVSQYDPGQIAKALPDALNAHPDASVFFAVSDQTALAAVPVIAQAGKSDQVKIIGLGGSGQGVAAIADGTVFGSTGTWPLQTGAFLARALVQAVGGEQVTDASIDLLKVAEPLLITKDSVSSFTPEWG